MLDRFLHLVGLERRGQLAVPSPELLSLFGATPNVAGVNVGPETALRSPTALACVTAIASAVGSLPIHLFRRGRDGSKERVRDHPVSLLLSSDWTPWSGNTEVRTALQVDLLTRGFAAAQVIRVGNGRPTEIHRLARVSMEVDDDTAEPAFKVNGRSQPLPHKEVLFLPCPGWSWDRPISIVDKARQSIGLDISMAERQGALFGNAVSSSGKLKVPQSMGKEAAQELIKLFSEKHAGPRRAGGIIGLFGGLEFEETPPFNSVDAQFLELRKLAIEDIARAFRVPLPLVGSLERATWRNIEELSILFVQYTLLPHLEVWQSALERALLTPEERQDFFVEFQINELLRGDIKARFEALNKAVGGAWLLPNEARALENLAPVDGGDELVRQAGQTGASDNEDDDEQTRDLRVVR